MTEALLAQHAEATAIQGIVPEGAPIPSMDMAQAELVEIMPDEAAALIAEAEGILASEGVSATVTTTEDGERIVTIEKATEQAEPQAVEGGGESRRGGHGLLRKGLAFAAAGLTLLGAKDIVKPASAEASLGLFGPKITNTQDMDRYVNFRLKNGGTCDPVRDGMAEALGLKSESALERYLSPENVTVIAKFTANNKEYKTSTGAAGCESVDIANVHPTSVAFRYALTKIPKGMEDKFTKINHGPNKGKWMVNDAALRGECGAQTIRRHPKKPAPHIRQRPDFNIDITAGIIAELEAQAESKATSSSSSTTTVTCPDGSSFTAVIKDSASADAFAKAIVELKGKGKHVVIKKSELVRNGGTADVEVKFGKKRDAYVAAAAKASADTQVDQQITANCAPVAPPPPGGETPPSPLPPFVAVEQKTPLFEGIDVLDQYTICATGESNPLTNDLRWAFIMRHSQLVRPDADIDHDGLGDIDGYVDPADHKRRCVDLEASDKPNTDDEVIVTGTDKVNGLTATDRTGKYPTRQPA